jgi:RNA polymerase sigma factor (sigma-70 family)
MLDLFMCDVRKYARLTPEEEVALGMRSRAGDKDAKEQLITSNLALVVNRAKYYARNGNLLDACQDGMFGLITAAEKYNPELVNPSSGKPYRFSTYAVWWIDRAIKNPIKFNQRLKRSGSVVSLDQLKDDEKFESALADKNPHDYSVEAHLREAAPRILDAISSLPEFERNIITHRYGLGVPPATLETLGQRYNVSRERIRQIEAKALQKLAVHLRDAA